MGLNFFFISVVIIVFMSPTTLHHNDPEFSISWVNIDCFQYWLRIISLHIRIFRALVSKDAIDLGVNSRRLAYRNSLFIFRSLLVITTLGIYSCILFYIFFELSLIPIVIMAIGWGEYPEREKAAQFILIYTLFTSGPILVVIITNIYAVAYVFDLDINFSNCSDPYGVYTNTWAILIVTAFLVKIPIFGIHQWLPIAHVQSPVWASIYLAAVLLKLGCLGVIRFSIDFIPNSILNTIYVLVIWGRFVVARISLCITNSKIIVAYSSVSHIRVFVFNYATGISWTVKSSLFLVITHSYNSSFLFYLVYVITLSSGTNDKIKSQNVSYYNPYYRFYLFLGLVSRLGSPPRIRLWPEVINVVSLYTVSQIFINSLFTGLFWSANFYFLVWCKTRSWKRNRNQANLIRPKLTSRHFFILDLHLIFTLLPIYVFFFLL